MAHVSERWILGNGPTDPEDCSRSDSHFCQLNLLPLGRNTGDKSQRRNTGVLFKYQSWEEALLLSHGQNELSGKKERGKSERFRITDSLLKSHTGLLSGPDVSEARAILTSAQARQRVSLLDSMKCDTEVTFNTFCHEMNTLTNQWSSSLLHERAPSKSKKWNELKPFTFLPNVPNRSASSWTFAAKARASIICWLIN